MGFGDFAPLCAQSVLPLCSALDPSNSSAINEAFPGLPTACFARTVEWANTIIFEPAVSALHIVTIIMTAVMIIHVRSKYTAVGRKEITLFFYLYEALIFVSLVLDAGVVPPGTVTYPYFSALQNALVSALCTCLMFNGFVGFQLYEDGTKLSMGIIIVVSTVMFAVTGLVSIFTYFGKAGLSANNTIGLFVVLYVVNALFLVIYVICQLLLVVGTLQDRWPLGDIAFGCFFFVMGQLFVYVLGEDICNGTSHYLDGLFFATLCNLLAVMMVYKFWDSITKEDLEFSVGSKQMNWDLKEPLMADVDTRASTYMDNPSSFSVPRNRASYTADKGARTPIHGGGL